MTNSYIEINFIDSYALLLHSKWHGVQRKSSHAINNFVVCSQNVYSMFVLLREMAQKFWTITNGTCARAHTHCAITLCRNSTQYHSRYPMSCVINYI